MITHESNSTNYRSTGARDSEWQWHQLGYMQVCTSLQTDNPTSTPPLFFYSLDALPAAQPTASKHWRHFKALKALCATKWCSVNLLVLCLQEGEGLMKQHHYASRDIEDQIKHLELTWSSLLAASEEKKERLQQAYQVSRKSIHCSHFWLSSHLVLQMEQLVDCVCV